MTDRPGATRSSNIAQHVRGQLMERIVGHRSRQTWSTVCVCVESDWPCNKLMSNQCRPGVELVSTERRVSVVRALRCAILSPKGETTTHLQHELSSLGLGRTALPTARRDEAHATPGVCSAMSFCAAREAPPENIEQLDFPTSNCNSTAFEFTRNGPQAAARGPPLWEGRQPAGARRATATATSTSSFSPT